MTGLRSVHDSSASAGDGGPGPAPGTGGVPAGPAANALGPAKVSGYASAAPDPGPGPRASASAGAGDTTAERGRHENVARLDGRRRY